MPFLPQHVVFESTIMQPKTCRLYKDQTPLFNSSPNPWVMWNYQTWITSLCRMDQAKFGDNNCEFQISQSPLKICEISEICGGLFQPMSLERFLHFYTEVKQIPVSVGTVFLQRRYRLHSSTFMSSKCTLELWETRIARNHAFRHQ